MSNFSESEIKSEKLRKLQEERLMIYQPHVKQLLFHQSDALIRACAAGNKGGKTYGVLMDDLWTAGKVHPYRTNLVGPVYGRICGTSFEPMFGIFESLLKTHVPRYPCRIHDRQWPGLEGYSFDKAFTWNQNEKVLRLADGGFIEFKSYSQEREDYQGPVRHWIHHDEEPPLNLYNENLARQMTCKMDIRFSFTPLNYSQWLYNELVEKSKIDPKIFLVQWSIYENPYCNRETVEKLEELYSDPAEAAARLYGEFTFLAGRVWKEYGDHNLVDDFPVPRSWHHTVVIDPHDEKPTEVCWFAKNPSDGLRYLYRHRVYVGDFKQVSEDIKTDSATERIDAWLIDRKSGEQKSTLRGSGSKLEEFRKHLTFALQPARPTDDISRDMVRQAVKDRPGHGPMLSVFRSCGLADWQMRNFSYKPPLKDGQNRPKSEVVRRGSEVPDMVQYYEAFHTVTDIGSEYQPFTIAMYGS